MPGLRRRWGNVIDAGRISAEREVELIRQWREGDRDAGAEVVFYHIRFTFSIARKYWRDGLDIDELICVGTTGLYRAMERFDESRGIRFSTYATWWIRAEIGDHIFKNRHLVSTGLPYGNSVAPALWDEMRRIELDGGNPTTDENVRHIAEKIGRGERSTRHAMEMLNSGREASLNFPLASDEGVPAEFGDLMESGLPSPEDQVERRERMRTVREEVKEVVTSVLNDSQAKIVNRYFEGRRGGEVPTLASMGRQMGFSRERARQIESIAFRKIRPHLRRKKAVAETI